MSGDRGSGRTHGRALRRLFQVAAVVALAAAISACSGSPRETNPRMYGLNDVVPQGGGAYKVGEPYQVEGRWYTPRQDPNYDRIGVASWYGEYFHGRKTANGEWYDMNRMSAAHPTLPLPVYARVTNLDNGRTLVVRVNDRGPFKKGREIDLSKGAATRLGFMEKGLTRVRVSYLTDAPLEGDVPEMQFVDRPGGVPDRTASLQSKRRAPAVAGPEVTGAIAVRGVEAPPAAAGPVPIIPKGFFVQAAAFASRDRADSLAATLAHLGEFAVLPVAIGDGTLYRVRTGPLATYEAADGTVRQLAGAGHAGARVFEGP